MFLVLPRRVDVQPPREKATVTESATTTIPRTFDRRDGENDAAFVKRVSLTIVTMALSHLLVKNADGVTDVLAAEIMSRVGVSVDKKGTVIGWTRHMRRKRVKISSQPKGPQVEYHPERGQSLDDQVAILAAACAYAVTHPSYSVAVELIEANGTTVQYASVEYCVFVLNPAHGRWRRHDQHNRHIVLV